MSLTHTSSGRERVRLDGSRTPMPQGKRARVRLPQGPASGSLTPHSGFENIITPEALAYALPGGLAKLAYRKWIYAPFIRYMEDRILEIVKEKQIHIMFSAPPRHGKTMFVGRVLPAWFLGRFPDKRVMLITYNTDFSRAQGRIARNIFDRYGQSVFGLKLAEDTSSAGHWNIQGHDGGMEAIGAGGPVTGKGADLLIIDDLVKGWEEAMSETLLEKRWDWFLADVYTRLEPGSSVIIMGTRWSMTDVIGRILQKQEEDKELGITDDISFEGWERINFPAMAGKNDILGRRPGQALFPQRFNEKTLRVMKNTQTEYAWEALYQGNPIPLKGSIINVDWFNGTGRRYTEFIPRNQFDMVVISADTANKDTELADFSVFTVWGVKDDYYYLLDVIREKYEWPRLVGKALEINFTWRPEFFLIEDKGSGIHLIQELRGQNLVTNIWPMDPGSESKILRAQSETPVIRSGKVRLPEQASWLDDFLMEMRSFPRGKKDQVDSMSQFLKFMRANTTGIQMW